MATEERKIVLTKLAHAQVSEIHDELSQVSSEDAEAFINDFLDIVFEEIKYFPFQFEKCEGMRSQGGDYRIGSIYGDYRVIFQISSKKTLILLIMHESELPF
jgi:mRNA-degrading endonuclease RelE of RelBE toxin-antitoxin system